MLIGECTRHSTLPLLLVGLAIVLELLRFSDAGGVGAIGSIVAEVGLAVEAGKRCAVALIAMAVEFLCRDVSLYLCAHCCEYAHGSAEDVPFWLRHRRSPVVAIAFVNKDISFFFKKKKKKLVALQSWGRERRRDTHLTGEGDHDGRDWEWRGGGRVDICK